MPDYGDVCPSCLPGLPATHPDVLERSSGGMLAAYKCAACGVAWHTWWDCRDQVGGRLIAPVTREQAERNRTVLADALRPLAEAYGAGFAGRPASREPAA